MTVSAILPLWYILALCAAVVFTFFTRSLILNIGLIVLAAAGITLVRAWENPDQLVQGAGIAVMIGLVCLGLYQIITQVREP